MRNPVTFISEKRIASMQNEIIAKHYEEVSNAYTQMRGWRHDYHNHIQIMKAQLSLNKLSELESYLNKLDDSLTVIDNIVKTGNITLDAILNSKLSLAAARNIRVNVKAAAPETMRINEVDLCIVVGNLLDNAIEACEKIASEQNRFIRIYIGRYKDQLYISVANATANKRKIHGGRYETHKTGVHGFGLKRIDRIIDKYDGYVNRQNEEAVFVTEIMFPV